jgi:hypothetical protein
MNFDIIAFIESKGFSQTRNSEKRDIFEKRYYYPFALETYSAEITISYGGVTSELHSSSKLMTIELRESKSVLFDGLAPKEFDDAEAIFKLVLPSLEELRSSMIES